MLAFVLLFLVNVLLLGGIIRWRGLNSAEGLGLAFVALIVVSDGLALFGTVLFNIGGVDYALGRMRAEVVPTVVHIFAIALFGLGLGIVDLRATPIQHELTDTERHYLSITGGAFTIVGLGMKVGAIYLWGAHSLSSYLDNLYVYDFRAREYSFLDQGVQIAAFGLVMLAIAQKENRVRQAMYLLGSLGVSMVLSLSKSGVIAVALPFYLLASTFSRSTLRAFTRPAMIFAGAMIFFVGLGIKTQVKYRGLNLTKLDPALVTEMAKQTIQARFSSAGLYRKYSYTVTRIMDDPTMALDGASTLGIVQGVIPRFVWREIFGMEKPPHPFYAKGLLVNEDLHVDLWANDAPSLVGIAFSDAGFLSLIPTMLLGGMLLAFVRVVWLARGRHVLTVIGYLYFASQFGGPTLAESGFLNFLYFLAWSLALVMLSWGVVWIVDGRSLVLEPAT
jgi:hypothetical protein